MEPNHRRNYHTELVEELAAKGIPSAMMVLSLMLL